MRNCKSSMIYKKMSRTINNLCEKMQTQEKIYRVSLLILLRSWRPILNWKKTLTWVSFRRSNSRKMRSSSLRGRSRDSVSIMRHSLICLRRVCANANRKSYHWKARWWNSISSCNRRPTLSCRETNGELTMTVCRRVRESYRSNWRALLPILASLRRNSTSRRQPN